MAEITARAVAEALGLQVAAGASRLDNAVLGGYASDLLSCVMAGAHKGDAWVTLQAHMNVVAVATLLDLACVIITEGARLDQAAQDRADEQGIPILYSPQGNYTVVARLAGLGIPGSR